MRSPSVGRGTSRSSSSLELSSQAAAIVFSDNCILCHVDPESQKKIHLFSADPKATQSNELLNLKSFVNDVHFRRGLSCSGCHGGLSGEGRDDPGHRRSLAQGRRPPRGPHLDSGVLCPVPRRPQLHAGLQPVASHRPALQVPESQHGILLLQQKDSKAAQCVSCHGVHGIRGPKSRRILRAPAGRPGDLRPLPRRPRSTWPDTRRTTERPCPPTSSSSLRSRCTERLCWKRATLALRPATAATATTRPCRRK